MAVNPNAWLYPITDPRNPNYVAPKTITGSGRPGMFVPAPAPVAPQNGTQAPAPTAPSPLLTPPSPVPASLPPLVTAQGGSGGSFDPFDPSSIGRSGQYGESVAFTATDYLKKLRAALDAGQISVADFLKLGQPAADTAIKEIGSVAGKGSKAANIVNPLVAQVNQAGFIQSSDGTVRAQLPDKYQQEAFKTKLPAGITPDQADEFLSQLPPGVDPFSDQGKIEIEKIREAAQAKKAQEEQTNLRNQAVTGLEGIIGQQAKIRDQGVSSLQQSLDAEANRQFSLDQPGIYEDLNARGLLSSSALGDALARQKAIYAGDVASRLGQAQYSNTLQSASDLDKLSAARLASTDADVANIQNALLNSNQLQQSGISRQFGLSDFQTQANLARALAAQQANAVSAGQGSGGGISGALTGALGGAGAFAATKNPYLIGGGALAGGIAGASSSRGK